MLILILLVLTGSYAGLWALRFVLEQRTDTEQGITPSRRIQSHLAEMLSRSLGRAEIRFPQSIDAPCRLFNVLASLRSWWSSLVTV